MNIENAIEILESELRYARNLYSMHGDDAIKLGIEAMKEVKRARSGDPALDGDLLPGETEE